VTKNGKNGHFWQKRAKTVENGSGCLEIKKMRSRFGASDSGMGVWRCDTRNGKFKPTDGTEWLT
jgi:hypothetical protein